MDKVPQCHCAGSEQAGDIRRNVFVSCVVLMLAVEKHQKAPEFSTLFVTLYLVETYAANAHFAVSFSRMANLLFLSK